MNVGQRLCFRKYGYFCLLSSYRKFLFAILEQPVAKILPVRASTCMQKTETPCEAAPLYLYRVIIALVLNRMRAKSLGTNVEYPRSSLSLFLPILSLPCLTHAFFRVQGVVVTQLQNDISVTFTFHRYFNFNFSKI